MKFFYLFILLGCVYIGHSQTDQVVFDYDNAGNQIIRELICITCDNPMRQAAPGFIQSKDYTQISYFPNPVVEELQIQWPYSASEVVISVEVYSLSGQRVNYLTIDKTELSAKLDFKVLSQGMYTVVLNYDNGTKKDLKVIKK